jgi:hypothetical protein
MNLTDAEKTEVTTGTQAVIDAALALKATVKRMGEKPAPWKPRFEVGDRVTDGDIFGDVVNVPRDGIYQVQTGPGSMRFCTEHELLKCEKPAPIDPLADVKAAHKAGKVIEWRWASALTGPWRDLKPNDAVNWSEHYEFRIKPLPDPQRELVPLEASDVPPGSYVRDRNGAADLCAVLAVSNFGIYLLTTPRGVELRTFRRIKELGYNILRPGQTEWQPCSKAAIRS